MLPKVTFMSCSTFGNGQLGPFMFNGTGNFGRCANPEGVIFKGGAKFREDPCTSANRGWRNFDKHPTQRSTRVAVHISLRPESVLNEVYRLDLALRR